MPAGRYSISCFGRNTSNVELSSEPVATSAKNSGLRVFVAPASVGRLSGSCTCVGGPARGFGRGTLAAFSAIGAIAAEFRSGVWERDERNVPPNAQDVARGRRELQLLIRVDHDRRSCAGICLVPGAAFDHWSGGQVLRPRPIRGMGSPRAGAGKSGSAHRAAGLQSLGGAGIRDRQVTAS